MVLTSGTTTDNHLLIQNKDNSFLNPCPGMDFALILTQYHHSQNIQGDPEFAEEPFGPDYHHHFGRNRIGLGHQCRSDSQCHRGSHPAQSSFFIH
jgi:hypothetical protein